MLVVKTYIDFSEILNAGLGLFAGEKILQYQIIWKNNSGSEVKYSQKNWNALPEPFRKSIEKYVYRFNGIYILNLDDSRHMNHSDTPNTIQDELGDYIASRDISDGEELTCNYSVFNDNEWFDGTF